MTTEEELFRLVVERAKLAKDADLLDRLIRHLKGVIIVLEECKRNVV